jgi:acyl-CoA reductase-like NAD-dependent aldehyde dehydrogenase
MLQSTRINSDSWTMRTRTSHAHVIQQLAARFATEAPALIDALVDDHRFARGAAPRHVQEALACLLAWPSKESGDGRGRISGSAGILLHEDAPFTSFARTLPAAVLSRCRRIVVNVPREAENTRSVLARICAHLPDVTIEAERSGTFLFRTLTDPDMHSIWAGGSPDLLQPFEALIEATTCQVIFEGPGNDPIVVGADMDVDAAARATAKLAFRDGGLDPASPNRVYVPESLHDAFAERVCAYAASYVMAAHTDIACSVAPLRSQATRQRIEGRLEEAEQAGAVLAEGREYRQYAGQAEPTLVPTVAIDCRGDLRIVTERARGPVLPVVPYRDPEALLAMLDATADPDGGVGSAVTLLGGEALRASLAPRFSYIFGADGPHAPNSREARLAWGGGPASWTLQGSPDGLERRFGPVDLIRVFSRARPVMVVEVSELEFSAHAAK